MKHQRNAPCHCGSGKKYKRCCLVLERQKREEALRRLYAPSPVVENTANTVSPESPVRRGFMPLHLSMALAATLASSNFSKR